jgi:hypothetical protein
VTVRILSRQLDDDELRPLEPHETVVQLSRLPTDAQMRRLASILEARPDATLRLWDAYGDWMHELPFLRFFPGLRHFAADSYGGLRSLEGLRHLADLESLQVASTKRPLSLKPIESFTGIRLLSIEGPHRDYEAISALTALEDLTLRSVTFADLSVLLPLERLRSLDIKLGGTRDLALLPRIGRLEYLELWMIRGLDDVTAIADVETLQHLFLEALTRVTRLPSFARSTALCRVDLAAMKGLTDLAPLAEAPNLEILNLGGMRHADPEILLPFVGHPTLRAGSWGFGSSRKNFAAQDLLRLPPEPYRYAYVRRGETSSPDVAPWDAPDWPGFRTADRS